jgi:hypothetical protein
LAVGTGNPLRIEAVGHREDVEGPIASLAYEGIEQLALRTGIIHRPSSTGRAGANPSGDVGVGQIVDGVAWYRRIDALVEPGSVLGLGGGSVSGAVRVPSPCPRPLCVAIDVLRRLRPRLYTTEMARRLRCWADCDVRSGAGREPSALRLYAPAHHVLLNRGLAVDVIKRGNIGTGAGDAFRAVAVLYGINVVGGFRQIA